MKNKYTKETIKEIEEEQNTKGASTKKEHGVLVSRVLKDGTIIETVCDLENEKTSFAVFKDGTVEYKESIEVNGKVFTPISAQEDILRHRVILFPSKAEEYGTVLDLLGRIQEFIHKYLEVSEFYEFLATHYVLFTWIYDKFQEVPYLRALGDYGCGKTRFLQTVGAFCYKPIFAGGATTTSPIFRLLNEIQGTLVLDEADFKFSDATQEIIKILNNGFASGFPVLRSEVSGKSFAPKAFHVFGPKIIGTREIFKDRALESRCLTEEMEIKTRKDIPLNLNQSFWEDSLEIRNQLLMFRFRTFHKPLSIRFEKNLKIEPRLQQIIGPILSIVEDKIGRDRIFSFVEKFQKEITDDRFDSFESGVLRAFIEVLNTSSQPTMKEIADKHNELFTPKYALAPRKTAEIIRKKLRFQTKKGNKGIYVLASESEKQIQKMKEKYGLEEAEVNDVNNVNEKTEIADPEYVRKAFEESPQEHDEYGTLRGGCPGSPEQDGLF